MAEQLQSKMTVDEFFEWQLDQDRNYELVDGVPVLATRPRDTSADHAARLIDNLKTVAPSGIGILAENGSYSLTWPDDNLAITVLPSPDGASYAFATAVTRAIFQGTGTFVLIDTDETRIVIWRGAHSDRRCTEATGLDALIDLPEIKAILPIADLYAVLTFPAPRRPNRV